MYFGNRAGIAEKSHYLFFMVTNLVTVHEQEM